VVPELSITPVETEENIEQWRRVHNEIVPPAAMSFDEARERVAVNHLEVAHLGETLVACTTVRPPVPPGKTATVIVRVLPEHRRQGIGERLYARALDKARELGAERVETIVWAANTAGLRFAEAHGFTEVSRYVPDGEDELWLTLGRML
jgi:GNAT superfamily N-acetyltransferase